MRNERIKLRLTREQVVTILSISMEEYTEYETGRIKPGESIINDLCNLYNTKKSYWIELEAVKDKP